MCMVDLLGRLRLLDGIRRFITSMPVEADVGTSGEVVAQTDDTVGLTSSYFLAGYHDSEHKEGMWAWSH